LKLAIYISLLYILIQTDQLFAQVVSEQHLEFETRSYSSTQSSLPFWLWANQKGMISEQGKFHQLSLLKYVGSLSDTAHQLRLSYGISLVSGINGGLTTSTNSVGSAITGNAFQLNEVFLTVTYKKVLLKIGE
jgi:hypothetical protein